MNYIINMTKVDGPPHKHKNYEIIAYIKGEGVVEAGGKNFKVSPGNFLIIPPDTLHHNIKSDGCLERIYINGEFNQIFYFNSPTLISDNSTNEGLLLAKIIYANCYTNYEYVTALINAFTHFLLQNIKMENEILLSIKNIVENISDNFSNCNINISDILKGSGYAVDYIRAQFKKVTGKTPNRFLTEIRIKHACYLINMYRNSLLLSEIAEKCGYNDYIYFSRRFKQITGITPQKYREEKIY